MLHPSSPARRIALALSLLGASACAIGSDDAIAWTGTIERDGETVVVRNPAEPLIPDSLVRVERLWVLAGDGAPRPASLAGSDLAGGDATGTPEWAGARDLVVIGDAAFFLDAQGARVHALALDGRWRGSFGRAGSGPGELRRASQLVALGDTLAVLDGGDPSLELFDTTGTHRRQIRLGAGIPFSVYPLGTDAVLAYVFDGGQAGWRRISRDGEQQPFAMPGERAAADGTTPRDRGCRLTRTVGLELLRLECAVPRLAVVDPSGNERLRITLPRDTVFAPAEELAAHRSQMLEIMTRSGMPANEAAANADRLLEAMRVREPFRGARRDPVSGVHGVWEQHGRDLEGEDDDPATLHLFSPDGAYLARIPFPQPWRDFTFVEGGVLALSVDEETGLVSVERHRITLPDDAVARAARLVPRGW